MSEAIALCHNKSHAERKPKMKTDVTQFEMDWLISITTMDFLFHDLAGEAHEEECCDIPYTVMTLIKKMALEPCHNILQLCHDIRNKDIR